MEVPIGGDYNLTCVAVGSPMPYVRWMQDDQSLTEEDNVPIGRNVLQLINIEASSNYTCVAASDLGTIQFTSQVIVTGIVLSLP